ncbi:hypothetical protein HJG60_011190 [Phyllostomus discolor]|uniref:Uncharacterized protein n=1 Tax=Phyllostomus discolor TaxID=89673 RepID=A0A833ZW92_9CHIR|nr:hypothetical protein HJG60_011190 [Phyllostomus discolor]
MILICRRKTSLGTSPIREAVNKITCSGTRAAGSSGWGPGAAWNAAQGSLAPQLGVPAGFRNPVSAFLGLATLWKREVAPARFPPPLLSSFLLPPPPPCPPPPHLRALSLLPSPKVESSPSLSGLRLSLPPSLQPQIPHCSPSNPSPLAPAYFTHHPGHGWVGLLSEALLKPLAEGTLGL